MNPATENPAQIQGTPPSLGLILSCRLGRQASIIDIGGREPALEAKLLGLGYSHLSVLDIAPEALQRCRESLGTDSGRIRWIEDDVTLFEAPHPFSLWHDRLVFPLLETPEQRRRYASALRRALRPGGYFILACPRPRGLAWIAGEFEADCRLVAQATELRGEAGAEPRLYDYGLFQAA